MKASKPALLPSDYYVQWLKPTARTVICSSPSRSYIEACEYDKTATIVHSVYVDTYSLSARFTFLFTPCHHVWRNNKFVILIYLIRIVRPFVHIATHP